MLFIVHKFPYLFKYALLIQSAEGKELLACALLHEGIGQSEVEGVPQELVLVQQGVDGAASTTCDDVFFHSDNNAVGVCQLQDECFVQWLDEAHVGDGGVEFLPHLFGGGDHAAPGEEGDMLALVFDFAFADGQGGESCLYGHAWAFATRIPDGSGAWVLEAGGEHLAAFVFVGRRHDEHVGDATEVAVVEAAGMGGAVGADEAGAVEGKEDVEVLDGDVVDELVVAALQEGGVDGDDGFGALAGLACG